MKWLHLSLCLFLLSITVEAQNRPISGDSSYNVLPLLINGNPPNLPAGSKVDGVPIGGGGATAFTDLTDVPSSYSGQALKGVRVNAAANALEFFTTSSFSPAALTRIDDTNVTLTLGGTPATALLQATSLTLGWSGTLAISRGGTGAATSGAHMFFANNTGSTGAPSFTSFIAGTNYWDTTVFTGGTNIGLVPQAIGIPTCLRFLDENGAWTCASGGTSDAAPKDAHYITIQAESGLSAEFSLSTLADGLLKHTVSTGVSTPARAIPGTDYEVPVTGSKSITRTTNDFALTNDSTTPGNSKYYGTDSGGTRGYFSLPTVSGAALTKVDDTNVTLTLGGSPSTALVNAASVTVGWAGQLSIGRGGTGVSSLGDITKVNDTNVTLTLGGTPTGAVITSTSLTLGWTGTLSVARGGSGAGTLTGLLVGNGTAAFTAVTAPSGAVVGTTDTQTLTNKRNTKRALSTSGPGATPTLNTDTYDVAHFTAVAANITSMTTNLSGTPVQGEQLRIDFTDDGTARTIAWGASFEDGGVALPLTTVISTRLDAILYWNTVTSKWRCMATSVFLGTATNDNAPAGAVGEYVSSLIASGSAVSLTNNTTVNITSISLTAGDWDVGGNVNFSETTSTVTARSAGTTSTSATVPTDGSEAFCGTQSTVTSETNSITLSRKRFSLSATTTVYLVGRASFSAGTCAGFGQITARRAR